jgi:hypothetical protein
MLHFGRLFFFSEDRRLIQPQYMIGVPVRGVEVLFYGIQVSLIMVFVCGRAAC